MAARDKREKREPGTAESRGVRPITDATIALRARRRRAHKRNLITAALAFGAALIVGALVWMVAFSSVLSAKRVEIAGTKVLSTTQVTQQAAVPIGTPLARIDLDAISQRVAKIPAVESVRVSRSYPTAITIEITERSVVMQRHEGGSYQWIDRTGVLFHTVQTKNPQVPVIETPTLDARLLKDLATVALALTPELKARLSVITATSPDTITLKLDKGQSVVWGSAAESPTKAQVATALLNVKATVFDVSSPANPTSR